MEKSPHKRNHVGFYESVKEEASSPPSSYYQLSTEEEIVRNINIFLDSEELLPNNNSCLITDDELSSESSGSFFTKKGFEIFLELFSLAFTMCDMSFVGILVYRHYMGDEDPLQAWAMLLPIFLSTFGVQLFFEKYPPNKTWWNEILNIPLIGPIFCTGELLYAKLKPACDETHRIEAESIKLKQYESIFRAYPEGMVMLSVLFINRSEETADFLQNWMMEILCVSFAVICLAEAHYYGIVSDFYRIHDKGRPSLLNHEDRQRPHQLHVWQRFLLFFHAVLAIGLRVLCEGLIRATVYFYLNKHSPVGEIRHTFAEVLLVVFFAEMGIRAGLHLFAQIIRELSIDCYKCLLNPFYQPQYRRRLPRGGGGGYSRIDSRTIDGTLEDEEGDHFEGIHGAVKHGLLATFSPLQFQSKYLPTVLWFYAENLVLLIGWFLFTRKVEVAAGGSGGVFLVYDRFIMIIAMGLFLAALTMQGVVSYLTFPDSDVCVVRIKRVPHRYITMANLPSCS